MEPEIHNVPIEMPKALPAPEPGACLHNEGLDVACKHVYLEDTRHHVLSLRATCQACGVPFRFAELQHAILTTRPCRDLSGITATLPVVPDEGLRKIAEHEHDWPECEER